MSHDVATGPAPEALFEALLDDAVLLDAGTDLPEDTSLAAAVQEHRDRLLGDDAHLMGPLVVPADRVEGFAGALLSGDHALRVLLVAPDGSEAGRTRLREARDLLTDDERTEIVGVRIGLPVGPAAIVVTGLLERLDFTAPAWIEVTPGAESGDAIAAVAADGAEGLALMAAADDQALACLLRSALDHGRSFRLVTGPAGAAVVRNARSHGVLNVLLAVRAGLDGADEVELAQVLARRDIALLVSQLRRLSDVAAATTRASLTSIEVNDVDALVGQLRDLQLTER
jgi:hypothetical protein